MYQQRQQAYLNLIQSLLNCCSNDELQKILTANQELLDAGFLQMLKEVAQTLSHQGDENTANWLRNLAMQLGRDLNLDTEEGLLYVTEEEIQEYFQFFLKLIRITYSGMEHTQVIDSFLADNTDKLDEVFVEILSNWGKNELGKQEANVREQLASAIANFSTRIQQLPLGNKTSNIEIAITGYKVALTVYTREAFPNEWAGTQIGLGFAYRNRIRGERAENIENTLVAYQAALTVYTREAFPYKWAAMQNGLGNIYCDRIRGKRAENIENAIAACKEALKVYTREAFPYDWAATQQNLGNAYCERIRGEIAENIEHAIAAYKEALTVYTREAFPNNWASGQMCLGTAYNDRIRGERAENIEHAIAAYKEALTVYTREAFPKEWAITQNNLSVAYKDRIWGDKAKNIENAIAAYKEALTVRTQSAFPYEWAGTQHNLGNAYKDRIWGKRAENIENAIAVYQAALTVRTQSAFPYEWADTQNSLGIAYKDRSWGDKAENIENAIAAYQAALTVFTHQAFPQDWAKTQQNIGNAYRDRIRGDKAENIENAIAAHKKSSTVYTHQAFPEKWAGTQQNIAIAYRNRIRGERVDNIGNAIAAATAALTVYTRQTFPDNHARTLFNLGMAYQEANNFISAYNTFASAIETIESLREEIISGEESKRKQAEEWNQLYISMVKVSLELDNITEAIEYVERSKTRNLVEQILERDSKTIFPLEVVAQLEQYRDKIVAGQYQIQNGKAENPQQLAQHLQELRRQRNELQNRYLPVGYGFKLDSFQPTLDKRTAIIEWYILNDKILAFIVTQKREITVWQSQSEDLEALVNWKNQYLQNYYSQKDQWLNKLGEELKKLASILHIDEILTQIPKHCDKLILIPHRFLHLFPLHALPVTSQNNQDSRCLLDLFPGGVSYAPSCQLLQQVQQRKRPDFQSLFAIQNPTEDLDFTDLEVETILSYFPSPSHEVLLKKQATKAALTQAATQLKQANYLHFSCHGSFNFNSPQNSCLLLAESVDENKNIDLNKCLTLGNLFERTFDFSQTRLVVLSACETGLVDFDNTSDEYISLPSGFLYAGSSSVVSSLWTVSDLSTALLMIKFIQILRNNTDMSVSLAMNKAQLWLRDATKEELQEWTSQLSLNPLKQIQLMLWFNDKEANSKPLESPFYWAAFTAVGN